MIRLDRKPYAIDRVFFGEMDYNGVEIKFSITTTDYPEQNLFNNFIKFEIIDWGDSSISKLRVDRRAVRELLTKYVNDNWKETTLVES